MTATVTKPGVYTMSDVDYHRDPVPEGSLSSTGARHILPPSCPALFKHEHDNGRPDTKAFDMGHAAHKLVLGEGPQIVRIEADSWRTNAAKDRAEEVRAEGGVPLLPKDFDTVVAMADALFAHPFAGKLFTPGNGQPEASIFWQDDPTGIWRRTRPDWLPNPGDGRMVVADYKSCDCAERDEFVKSATKYGYHQQHAWVLDGIKAMGLADDAVFLLVAQEKKPPYLVNVIQLDVLAVRIGHYLNRQAIETYAECQRTGEWPGYSKDVELASLPGWYTNRYEDAI